MSNKIRKTLYLPPWINDYIDAEGKHSDGLNTLVGASIWAYAKLTSKEKLAVLKAYKEIEIEKIFADVEPKNIDAAREVLRRISQKNIPASNTNETITIHVNPSDPNSWDELRKVVESVRGKKAKRSNTA